MPATNPAVSLSPSGAKISPMAGSQTPDNEAARFTRFALSAENWNSGPVLELHMAYATALQLKTAWFDLWNDPLVHGPFSDHAITKPTDARLMHSDRVKTYGRLHCATGIIGFKIAVSGGEAISLWIPPRMAKRLAPHCTEPGDPGAIVLHAHLCELATRLRGRVEWCGASVAFEDDVPWTRLEELRTFGDVVVVPPWVAQHVHGTKVARAR